MFYLGSHLGTFGDGYICSSPRMSAQFKKRPLDFKRRILQICDVKSHNQLKQIEQCFLDLIKDTELNVKYYNVKKVAMGGSIKGHKKASNVNYGWNKGLTKEILNLRKLGLFSLLIDKPKVKHRKAWTDEQKQLNSLAMKIYWEEYFAGKRHPRSSPIKKKKKETIKRPDGKPWNYGLSKETDERIKEYSNKLTGKEPWNKGKQNQLAAASGKKGAAKLSKTATGRKLGLRDDGTRYWYHPNNQTA